MVNDNRRYELVQVFDEDIRRTRKINSTTWKGPLSESDYLLRESVIYKSPSTNSGDNRVMVFILRDNEDHSRILSSVELLVRKAWKVKWDVLEKQARQKEVFCGCIGAVHTNPDHRGRGFAQIMVDQLVFLAKNEIVGSEGFLFLYSEIGEYYTRNGFKFFDVPLTAIPVPKLVSSFEQAVKNEKASVNLVKYHDFSSLFESYSNQLSNTLKNKTAEDKNMRVSLIPNLGTLDWFHLRAKFISQRLFYNHIPVDFSKPYSDIVAQLKDIEPSVFGIKICDKNKLLGFISWTHDWKYNNKERIYECSVVVIKIFVDKDEDFTACAKKLIYFMLTYCGEYNLTADAPINLVTIWESELNHGVKEFLTENFNASTGLDNSSKSAILMNDGSEDKLLHEGKLVWENNTKLPWF